MSTGIILYRSKYGAAKTYATWLKNYTGFDIMEVSQADIATVQKYDTVILGGGIYASGINGFSFLKKNHSKLTGKQILVFCVGASPYDEAAFGQVRQRHFTGALSDIPLFYCRGAWDEEKMTAPDRLLCSMLYKAVSKIDPEKYEPWQAAIMECWGKKCSWVDPDYLAPILEFLGCV